MKTFDEIFIDQTKYGVKVQTSEYGEKGKYIIIDQGKAQIAGYTDREEGVFKEVPAIVFGDHTKAIKYVDKPFFLGADGVKVLRSKDSDANYKYLYYALKNVKIPNTGYNRHFKWLKEIQINYPNKNKQDEIVGILDKVSDVMQKREMELSALDGLIKSRFIEMFGDPVTNPHGFMVVSLQKLIDRGMITYHLDGNHGSDYPRTEEFTSDGVPYIGANCIVGGKIDFTLAKYLSPERANRLRKGIAQNGDVLFAHNATVGPVVVLETTQEKVILSTSLTAYRCDCHQINPYYLRSYMESDGFVTQYSYEMKQTTRNQVPITAQRKYLFIVPPIDLQEQFATFVAQTDKSKAIIQKSLDEIQILFDSLMQKYFG